MLFGLSGAHRSGKTTVMESLGSMTKLPIVKTSTAKVVEREGIDLSKPMPLKDRISFQKKVLENYRGEIDEALKRAQPVIVDRTPVDMASYLLADVGMSSHKELGPDGIAAVNDYVTFCQDFVRSYFGFIFVLRPLPIYDAEANKPADNVAYQQHYQMVIEGFLCALQGEVDYAIITLDDHDARVSAIKKIIAKATDVVADKSRIATLH